MNEWESEKPIKKILSKSHKTIIIKQPFLVMLRSPFLYVIFVSTTKRATNDSRTKLGFVFSISQPRPTLLRNFDNFIWRMKLMPFLKLFFSFAVVEGSLVSAYEERFKYSSHGSKYFNLSYINVLFFKHWT